MSRRQLVQLFGRVDLSTLIPGQVPQSVLDSDVVYQKLLGEVQRQERYIENRSYTPKTDVLQMLEGGEE